MSKSQEMQPEYSAGEPRAGTAPDVCEHGIRKPWECRPCADAAWETRGASEPPPTDYRAEHIDAAWAELPADLQGDRCDKPHKLYLAVRELAARAAQQMVTNAKYTTADLLHYLRNPSGLSASEVRRVRIESADEIEHLMKMLRKANASAPAKPTLDQITPFPSEARPAGCICDEASWGSQFNRVCSAPTEEGVTGRCKHCEHDMKCHAQETLQESGRCADQTSGASVAPTPRGSLPNSLGNEHLYQPDQEWMNAPLGASQPPSDALAELDELARHMQEHNYGRPTIVQEVQASLRIMRMMKADHTSETKETSP